MHILDIPISLFDLLLVIDISVDWLPIVMVVIDHMIMHHKFSFIILDFIYFMDSEAFELPLKF